MEQIPAQSAAEALRDVARRQEQVIDLASIPTWYWWVVGALMVVLAAGVDARRPVAVGIATCVFVCGLLGATASVLFRGVRSAQLRNDLLGSRGAGAILAFVFTIVGVTLALAFALRFAGASDPATIACAVGGLGMGLGGPVLMRYLRRTMLAGRVGETH